MKPSLRNLLLGTCLALIGNAALAKLPALSDEAKAKAAEAAAKTGWTGKLEAYQLCKAQDKVAAAYKKAKPAASACVDPGPFVYVAAAAAPPVAASPAVAPAAAPPVAASPAVAPAAAPPVAASPAVAPAAAPAAPAKKP